MRKNAYTAKDKSRLIRNAFLKKIFGRAKDELFYVILVVILVIVD